MAKYKVYWVDADEEDDEVFDTEQDALNHALYMRACSRLGAEIMSLSNPGDYDCDEDDFEEDDFEIIEEED